MSDSIYKINGEILNLKRNVYGWRNWRANVFRHIRHNEN